MSARDKQSQYEYPGEIQWTKDNQFLSRGSRACRHASPRCVDQRLVVRRLIGTTPNLH